jgi:outer membrane protein assembly factor BamB
MKLRPILSDWFTFTLALPLFAAPLSAADWPHWLGPNGDNRAPAGEHFDADISKWKVAWKASIGHGYSAVSVADGRAYSLGHDGQAQETVFCFDAVTGEVKWKHSYNAELIAKMHGGGPNSTPTIVGNRVITLSKDGQILCLAADKGTPLWRTSLSEAAGLKTPNWGFASSPVINGKQVIFAAGKVVALDLESGKMLWTSKNDYPSGYTTAVAFETDGRKLVAALDGKGLSILSAIDGEEITRHPYKANFDVTGSTPYALAKGHRIFLSGNTSSELLTFDGQKLDPIWSSKELKNALNNSVLADGVVYGIDGRQGTASSRLVALNLEDGVVKWAKADFGYGALIGVGGTLLALTENGEVVTAKISPASYAELGRQQVLAKTCWTPPTYAGGRIYVRNDRGDLVCLAAN